MLSLVVEALDSPVSLVQVLLVLVGSDLEHADYEVWCSTAEVVAPVALLIQNQDRVAAGRLVEQRRQVAKLLNLVLAHFSLESTVEVGLPLRADLPVNQDDGSFLGLFECPSYNVNVFLEHDWGWLVRLHGTPGLVVEAGEAQDVIEEDSLLLLVGGEGLSREQDEVRVALGLRFVIPDELQELLGMLEEDSVELVDDLVSGLRFQEFVQVVVVLGPVLHIHLVVALDVVFNITVG